MNYISSHFAVRGKHAGNRVFLTQEVKEAPCHTKHLPATFFVLQKSIPTIFENKCFNDKNLSFRDEVVNTEVGHLFEHLIIENLRILSEKKYGFGDFSGVTSWNWVKCKKKNFKITISSKRIEEDMFAEAFARSVQILENIYNKNQAKSGKKTSRPLVLG